VLGREDDDSEVDSIERKKIIGIKNENRKPTITKQTNKTKENKSMKKNGQTNKKNPQIQQTKLFFNFQKKKKRKTPASGTIKFHSYLHS
jgi:hypothetical protein